MSRIPSKPNKRVVKAHPFFGSKTLNIEESKQLFAQKYQQGDYDGALKISLNFVRQYPQVAQAWSDAAACCTYLERWEDVINYASRAIALDPQIWSAFDALSHAHGALLNLPEVKQYGLRALEIRDAQFGRAPSSALPIPMPSKNTHRSQNIIAFSLFGGSSKYCETAVLNAIEQPLIYPDWTCRFYVDETVPEHVLERLRRHDAQVVLVDEVLKKWPGPMWRFAAYDDPLVERVMFRDADSVISTREAGAVAQWIDSGKAFHMMRDNGTHTELILAGLWACVRDSLPPMAEMVKAFLSKPVASQHFADQYFLREYVWPYARQSLMQHDSLFGFMGGVPFPDGDFSPDFHTGYAEGAPSFSSPMDVPDGTVVTWSLCDQTQQPETVICRYPATVHHKLIKAHLPRRFTQKLDHGYVIRVEK